MSNYQSTGSINVTQNIIQGETGEFYKVRKESNQIDPNCIVKITIENVSDYKGSVLTLEEYTWQLSNNSSLCGHPEFVLLPKPVKIH
jgi:hypothetical protein